MLTDAKCRNAKCPTDKARARLSDAEGLYLEVSPQSARWFWKYRFEGKEKRLALGVYPAVGLSEARKARDEARTTLKTGADPVASRQESRREERRREAEQASNTFEAVARRWYEHWRGAQTERHAEYVRRRLEADVFPAIGARPIGEITARELVAMAEKIQEREALELARRSIQYCGQVFRWAVARDIVERNPAADVKPRDVLKPRDRRNYARLSAKELPELLRKIEGYAGAYTRLAMKLMALTFVRTGELIGARWDEFENLDGGAGLWRIPAARMKMKTEHLVPLSRQAVDVLHSLYEIRGRSGLLFVGERNHEKPMSNNTILKALERMGYKHRMTGHGFRGVASTELHELGFPHEWIELQLAHQQRDQVAAAYNHAGYLAQRRQMMQAWADRLDELRQGAKVVPIRAA
ncbi:MAG: tyrosine-type recombinase/integrase [Burkholderiaceae bacterium]|nr:tyrosine-type recombinase/integrase [Burkholderiaceae bacterium]